MNLKQRYSYLKMEYSDYVILIKSGNFYITYHEDALILNNIFGYQKINDRAGFPLNALDKVKSGLKAKMISYVVVDSDNLEKNKIKKNNYLEYFEIAKNREFKDSLNKILLDKIKFLIEQSDKNYEKIKRFIDEF